MTLSHSLYQKPQWHRMQTTLPKKADESQLLVAQSFFELWLKEDRTTQDAEQKQCLLKDTVTCTLPEVLVESTE